MTEAELIARYDGRVPRYTSYPTAPQFSTAVTADRYAEWLTELPLDAPVSLYLHVPFCDRLCLYCGCNTTVVRLDAPRRSYATLLERELRLVAERIGRRSVVTQLHWGGGTPTTLPADCLTRIMTLVRDLFSVSPDAEVAIEIDPTSLSPDRLSALAAMGVNRASLGVQDFDTKVQSAIGRMQSYVDTEAAAAGLRRINIGSLNLDLIYGLPHQTEQSVERTARQALGLNADRIAVFGYAHVPWMKRHQALIPAASLPGPEQRFAQSAVIRRVLEQEGGYIPVGLDHYARPDDAMAVATRSRQLHRSFQGYTTDVAPVLIGIGASAIGSLPQGYLQNASSVPAYAAAIGANQFATVRGVALTPDDRLRREVIERLMCDLEADLVAIAATLHADPGPLLEAGGGLGGMADDGLLHWDGRRVQVTEAGRPFVRNIAAAFDAYLSPDQAVRRHAQAV